MFVELDINKKNPTKILCDSKFAIALIRNLIFHDRSKSISIKFHYIYIYISELMKNSEIKLEFCRSKNQIANIFTKLLKVDVLNKLKIILDLID